MKIFLLEITLRAVWVHSLKEKRMILRSITQKLSKIIKGFKNKKFKLNSLDLF